MCIGKFATQNAKAKEKVSASQRATQSVESVRDMFIRILIVVAKNTHFDLQNILTYPLTPYPLSIAHYDGSPLKTDKAALTKRLEIYQT